MAVMVLSMSVTIFDIMTNELAAFVDLSFRVRKRYAWSYSKASPIESMDDKFYTLQFDGITAKSEWQNNKITK